VRRALADRLTRRAFLAAGVAGAASFALPLPRVLAQAGRRSHGLSIFGELKYPAGFPHFDYVVPDAPKGGTFRFQVSSWVFNQNPETFNTLNTFVQRGDAAPLLDGIHDSLMAGTADEPDSIYGLVAEEVEVSADGNTYRYLLRPEARFHDGSPLTARDAAWSFMTLKEHGHPHISQSLREFESAEAVGDHELLVTLSGNQTVDVPLLVAGLPIFSATWFESHDFERAGLDVPLGSAAYRVGDFAVGRYIEYERVADYWAVDLGVNVGQSNFDRLRLDFFADRIPQFEAFKAGQIRWRQEATASIWATGYDFPAIRDGRVVREEFPTTLRSTAYGLYINTRRAKFADQRTREALGLCFDFEWTNRNIFHGLYQRQSSYFEGSEFVATGEPSPEELALLEPLRADLPPAVFGPVVVPPVSDGSGRDRVALRRAADLLAEAGWTREGNGLRNASGEALTVEFLMDSQLFERILSGFVTNLRAIGVDATIRLVDPVQASAREATFDFDIVPRASSSPPTPLDGNDQFFSTESADIEGSWNMSGLKNAAVDALLARIPAVRSRDELITVLRALDRTVRAMHLWIPAWYAGVNRVAYWDMFGFPPEPPAYAWPVAGTWWYDATKAASHGITD
jgi:microcin C transport system substrate-binding protein